MKKFCLALLTALVGLTWAQLDLKQLCLDKSLNEVLAHPQDCRGYILCSEEPSEHYCDLGFHFDNKRMVCDWPEIVNCQLASQSAEVIQYAINPLLTSFKALDIMTGEVIDPMIAFDPLNVVCRHFGAYFLPNPQQCRSYYLCAYGHMHEHACGANTLWDYRTQQCVLNHKAVCYHLTEKEEEEIDESLANNMQNSSLVCYPINTTTTTTTFATLYPTGSDHTRPVMSTTARTYTPPTMSKTSTKEPNISNPYNIICPARRQSYVAHPKDCSKYFICIMGKAVMTSCPAGLLWDLKREYCEKNVKCSTEKNI